MLRKTVLVRALSIAFGAAALAAAVSQPAMAQSNASGSIFGRVDTPAGATVILNNIDTGLKRVMTPDASGRYTATAMPTGHYRVDLVRDSKVASSTEVDLIVGQGVEASFTSAVTQVQVTGRRSRIDVSSTNNGATFTAKELAALPIAQSVSAIIQLAPNTTRADPRYAAGASVGGGGASENSYYINGFPVANPLTQLGASELPFGAIAQAQILTGGFGAEFGRSIGGVVNITTKSGTNNWEFGATASTEPNSLRSKPKDVYYANTGDPANKATDGTLYAKNSTSTDETTRGGFYVGGPIIKDTLFMFVAVERINQKESGVSGTSAASVISNSNTGWLDQSNKTTRYLGKLDWNITDNHRLEYTTIGDKPESDLLYSGYNYASNTRAPAVLPSGGHYESIASVTPTTGADTNILKYTGNWTDDLTVTALYGENKTDHDQTLLGYGPSTPGISATAANSAPGFVYNNPQPFTGKRVGLPYSYDRVKMHRLDLEYKLGSHTLRAGIDDVKLASYGAGEVTAGGSTWVYQHSLTPTKPATLGGVGGVIIANGGGLGSQGYYVYRSIFSDTTQAFSDQSAQFIEDSWQVNKNVVVKMGVRNETYKNKNGDGVTFLNIDRNIDPRLSAAWDVNGDATTKVFGSAGRYSIQIPTHVAVRGASRSTLTSEFFTYSGVAADGQPTGLKNLTGVTSSDNEFGQAKLAETVSAQNLRPSYQDEITAGFEHAFSPSLNFGAKVTYRKLRETIDDFCDQRPFDAYAAAHNIDESNWGGFNCASINPGESNDFLVDYANTGKNLTKVTLSAADMGFEKAARIYKALDLFAEHPLRDGWYGRINYTWSRSTGNTEGQTLSAVAQTDVSATETWDHRELMVGADGLLPNDREHQIKAFGFYEVAPQWTIGGNLLVASGQPETCLGNYPDALQKVDPGFPDYGSAYHYCYGPAGANVLSPQGSSARLPWDVRLDMDVVFKPVQMPGLAFKMDIFNVTNKQTVQQIDQTYNTATGSISPTFGTPGAFVGYTSPRSVKFTVEYNHRF